MSIQENFKQKSLQSLVNLLASHKTTRANILKLIEKKAYKEMVEETSKDRPKPVLEDTYEYTMALLHSFYRALDRGLISKQVLTRLTDIFVNKVVLSHERDEAARALGFEPPLLVVVSPTGKCNLRCVGCYAASDPNQHGSLSFETFDRILREKREFWGSHFTVISGGEPTLWRDGKKDIFDMVARHSEDVFMMYSNATLISDEVAKRMGELGNITPAISVEGFERETDARRGKGTYRLILKAFESLRKYGVPFGISATPTKYNWDIITSDRFIDYYFFQQGAVYGWLFQYMPVGRGQTLELMVQPEDRVKMLKRTQRIVREKKVFVADFWNSGVASSGCISAGRPGGYFYIDWNGDITPCVFIPYAADNIHRIYAKGGNINTVLKSPFFKAIRTWQDEYGYRQPAEKTGNWFRPCIIRDHFSVLEDAVAKNKPVPINDEAAVAIKDKAYCEGMIRYDQELKRLTEPIWTEKYLEKGAGHTEPLPRMRSRAETLPREHGQGL